MRSVQSTKKDLREVFEGRNNAIKNNQKGDEKKVEKVNLADKKSVLSSPPSPHVAAKQDDKKTSTSGKFKLSIGGIVKLLIVLLTLFTFLYYIPASLRDPANVAQAFVKSTNFTIEGNSSDFGSIKKNPALRTDANGKVNFMIVGVDTRDTPQKGGNVRNTDTMMIGSYDPKTNRIALLSFPRDIAVPFPGTPSVGKINATYAVGETRNKGSGLEYMKGMFESISGTTIQYYVMVDLKGFTTIIDQLGGIDVYVDNSFTDYRYPTENLRYRTVSFTKGWTHMDGQTALIFSRSRKAAQAIEASDFARARRQQKVIQGVIDKAQSQETLQNPKRIFEILNTVAANIYINQVTPEDVQAGLNLLKEKGKPIIYNTVMDPAVANGTLFQVGGWNTQNLGYTVTPKAGLKNWGPAKQFMMDFFAEPTLVGHNLSIPVLNGKSGNFSGEYKALTNRFFYVKFYNGGSTDEYTSDSVYNFGGADYALLGKYIAGNTNLNYVEVADGIQVPPRKDGAPLVIVLGK